MGSARLSNAELHDALLSALGDSVISHTHLDEKPLEVDLLPPLPQRVRVYMYNATHPPGGRTTGEHKVQLIVPGQRRGEYGSFDHSDGRIVLLIGYEAELDVFILWEAGLYPSFAYSRNVQVKAETVYAALAGRMSTQERRIRGQGLEVVLTARSTHLSEAIQERVRLTISRLTEQ